MLYNILGQLCFKKDKKLFKIFLKVTLQGIRKEMVTKALISLSTSAVEKMAKKELVKFDDKVTLR